MFWKHNVLETLLIGVGWNWWSSMKLAFLDRFRETERLRRRFRMESQQLLFLYGRRRCGKSRLLRETVTGFPHVYFVANLSEASLSRAELAVEIERLIPGFAGVAYPGWKELFERWRNDAPSGAVLVVDEFPYLAASSPELPTVLQHFFDEAGDKPLHYAFCGSSQRMMTGMVLEGSAPLYGRASEVLKIGPLGIHWLREAFGQISATDTISTYAHLGGIPRYWELALDFPDWNEAVRNVILDPNGALHNEPARLLSDELQDTRQASSVLTLIAQGVHRISEIGARLGKPATSLSRPLSLLTKLGFAKREVPFGHSVRDTKRTFYRLADPFLNYWYRFVEPNRSLLQLYRLESVEKRIRREWEVYLEGIWEDISRECVPFLSIENEEWGPAGRWWGKGVDGTNLEIDLLAEAVDRPNRVLAGEVKLTSDPGKSEGYMRALRKKAAVCPCLKGKDVVFRLWVMEHRGEKPQYVVDAQSVLREIRKADSPRIDE